MIIDRSIALTEKIEQAIKDLPCITCTHFEVCAEHLGGADLYIVSADCRHHTPVADTSALELTEEELDFIYTRCSNKAARMEEANLKGTPCYRLSWQIMNKINSLRKGNTKNHGT